MVEKIVKNLILCLLLFFSCIHVINASSKLCNITIYSHIKNDNDESVVIDGSFNLFQISRLVDGEYIIDGDFKDIIISIDNMTSSQIRDTANMLKDFTVKNKIIPSITADSDINGYTHFYNLEQGLYLIYQNDIDSKYITNPILINVPFNKDGSLIFDISIDAKYIEKDVVVNGGNNSQSNSNTTDNVINTSDTTSLDTWILICSISFIGMNLLGFYYLKENKG